MAGSQIGTLGTCAQASNTIPQVFVLAIVYGFNTSLFLALTGFRRSLGFHKIHNKHVVAFTLLLWLGSSAQVVAYMSCYYKPSPSSEDNGEPTVSLLIIAFISLEAIIADAMIIWRVWVVYHRFTAIIIPCGIFLWCIVAVGLMLHARSILNESTLRLYYSLFVSSSVFLNVLGTVLIMICIIRKMWRTRIPYRLDIIAIVVESATLYTVCGILLTCFMYKNVPAEHIAEPVYGQISCTAALLILIRCRVVSKHRESGTGSGMIHSALQFTALRSGQAVTISTLPLAGFPHQPPSITTSSILSGTAEVEPSAPNPEPRDYSSSNNTVPRYDSQSLAMASESQYQELQQLARDHLQIPKSEVEGSNTSCDCILKAYQPNRVPIHLEIVSFLATLEHNAETTEDMIHVRWSYQSDTPQVTGMDALALSFLSDESPPKEYSFALHRWSRICDPLFPHIVGLYQRETDFGTSDLILLSFTDKHLQDMTIVQLLDELQNRMHYLLQRYPEVYNSSHDRLLILQWIIGRSAIPNIIKNIEWFVLTILSQAGLRDRIMAWEFPVGVCILDLLQAFMDKNPPVTSQKQCYRFIKELASKLQSLPSSLLCTGILTMAKHPVAEGNYGIVYRGRYHETDVAVKVLRPKPDSSKSILELVQREAIMWTQLKHPYILKFLGVWIDNSGNPCLISPWMSQGHLRSYVRENPACDRKSFVMQILRGISYLHSVVEIVHGDLRADNILVDESYQAQIADLGLANFSPGLQSEPTSGASKGAARWMAPEYLGPDMPVGKQKEGDVYSFACVVLEIFEDKDPFYHLSNDGQVAVAKVFKHEIPINPIVHNSVVVDLGFTKRVWSTLFLCWDYNLSNRPTISQLARSFGDIFDLKCSDGH